MAKGNNSLQNCKKLLWTLGRTPTLLNPCLGSGSGLLSGLRGNPQSSHWVLGLHSLRYWGWPETSRKLLEAFGTSKGSSGRGLWCPCIGTLLARHPCLQKRAACTFSAPLLSVVCFFLKLFINLSAGPCFCS